ncbi:MAG: hypothetical protein ABJA60_09190 [Nitrosospira sp.]
MISSSLPSQLDSLSGLVERVTYHNSENGFCVLRLKVKGERELATLIGHTPSVTPGEYAVASGNWVVDRERGRQFVAIFVKISPPNTLTGIERYLGSGMVKGIGPIYAGRLVKAFGAGVFEVIERSPGGCVKSTASARSGRKRSPPAGPIRRLSARSWYSCTPMVSPHRGQYVFSELTGRKPLQ